MNNQKRPRVDRARHSRARVGRARAPMSRKNANAPPHWMSEAQTERADARTATREAQTLRHPEGHLEREATTAATTAWETHVAPDGRTYYYHPETRRSTYAKPEEMMTTMERAEAATRWRKFTAPAADSTGAMKTYWAHEDTGVTTWETPKEIEEVREIVRRAEARATGPGGRGTGAGRAESRNESGRASGEDAAPFAKEYASMEEAKQAFKKMLAEYGVRGSTKWDEVVNRAGADARFSALRSTGEKKQCLNEYQMAQAKIEREAKRMAEKKAREAFRAMLEEHGEALGLTSNSRLSRDGSLEQALRDDARWRAVTDQRERAEIFEDYTRDLRVREKHEREHTKTKRASAFRECLIEAGATSETTWRKIYEVVKDDPRCERCEPLARLDVFESLVRDLEREEMTKLEVERKAKAREERKRREDFVALLAESQADGIITPRMPWKSFVKRIENDERYVRLCQNLDGSRPRELFEDLIDEIEGEIDRKLDDFEDLLRDGYKARELHGNTTWEKAEKLYRHDKAWKQAPQDEARKLFVKFIAKVFRREQEKERRKREGIRSEDDADRPSSRKKSRRDRSASR